jgi:hypothetical protein
MKARLLLISCLFFAATACARADFNFIFDSSGLLINIGSGSLFGDGSLGGNSLLNPVTIINGNTLQQSASPPIITAQPVSIITPVGHNVVFVASVSGPGPLSYHWQKSGKNLTNNSRVSGACSSILSITNLKKSDSGSYRVVISNRAGSIASRVATLTVY